MTTAFSLCTTCGVEHHHPLSDVCAICADERQYLPADGIQRWSTLEELQTNRSIEISEMEPGLHGLSTSPPVGIGHRPILVQTPEGNLLWDPPGYIDVAAIEAVGKLGGVRWIVASHPHMYGVQVEWSKAFNDAPVYINERDAEWVSRHSDAMIQWDGELELAQGLKIIRVGGHFPGNCIVHWRGHDGEGVLLSGDAFVPVPAKGWVTFLRSYPNRLPLSGGTVKRIADQVSELDFDRLYGNFPEPVITNDARQAVKQSADRHIAWVTGKFDHLT